MSYAERAKELFCSGLNCSQAVFTAFSEVLGIDESTAKKVSIGLGGGVDAGSLAVGEVGGKTVSIGHVGRWYSE